MDLGKEVNVNLKSQTSEGEMGREEEREWEGWDGGRGEKERQRGRGERGKGGGKRRGDGSVLLPTNKINLEYVNSLILTLDLFDKCSSGL